MAQPGQAAEQGRTTELQYATIGDEQVNGLAIQQRQDLGNTRCCPHAVSAFCQELLQFALDRRVAVDDQDIHAGTGAPLSIESLLLWLARECPCLLGGLLYPHRESEQTPRPHRGASLLQAEQIRSNAGWFSRSTSRHLTPCTAEQQSQHRRRGVNVVEPSSPRLRSINRR